MKRGDATGLMYKYPAKIVMNWMVSRNGLMEWVK